MSWIKTPSKMWIPTIPGMTPSDLWHGYGTDAGYVAFATGASAIGARVITNGECCYKLTVTGWSDFLPQYGVVNGYIHWFSASNYWLYRSVNRGAWIIHNKFPGYEPIDNIDGWYQSSTLPFGDSGTASFTASGTLSGGAAKVVTFLFPRWYYTTLFGVYAAAGGTSGTKSLGSPRWTSGGGVYYTRSALKSGSYYTYSAIYHHSSGWIIGTYGDAGGWYIGSEPSLTAPVTFTQTVTAATLTITFNDYVQGTETINGRLGEVTVWR